MGTGSQLEQNETMPKVDLIRDSKKLKFTDTVYMKRMEQQNFERATRVQAYRKANNRIASVLGLVVIGIYTYTMYSFKQETFLDDFNEPEKIIKEAE